MVNATVDGGRLDVGHGTDAAVDGGCVADVTLLQAAADAAVDVRGVTDIACRCTQAAGVSVCVCDEGVPLSVTCRESYGQQALVCDEGAPLSPCVTSPPTPPWMLVACPTLPTLSTPTLLATLRAPSTMLALSTLTALAMPPLMEDDSTFSTFWMPPLMVDA